MNKTFFEKDGIELFCQRANLSFEDYEKFMEQDVDEMKILLKLEESDVDKLGFSVGKRIKIMDEIVLHQFSMKVSTQLKKIGMLQNEEELFSYAYFLAKSYENFELYVFKEPPPPKKKKKKKLKPKIFLAAINRKGLPKEDEMSAGETSSSKERESGSTTSSSS